MSRDVTLLHPKVQEMTKKLIAECEEAGLKILITETMRTKSEQDALYAKGRTTAGKIVTNVRYPNSFHCWGLAIDFCKNVKGHEYDDPKFFKSVAKIAKSIGFTWGGDWKSFVDTPHLQYDAYGSTSSKLVSKYGTPDKFKKTWGTATTTKPTTSTSIKDLNEKEKYKLLQEALNKDGFTDADGKKLTVDGIIGVKAKSSLDKVNIKATGDKKYAIVELVQRLLVANGYKEVAIDGYSGPTTGKYVKKMKEKLGFTKITGTITRSFILKLIRY